MWVLTKGGLVCIATCRPVRTVGSHHPVVHAHHLGRYADPSGARVYRYGPVTKCNPFLAPLSRPEKRLLGRPRFFAWDVTPRAGAVPKRHCLSGPHVNNVGADPPLGQPTPPARSPARGRSLGRRGARRTARPAARGPDRQTAGTGQGDRARRPGWAPRGGARTNSK